MAEYELEREVLAAVSREELMRHTAYLSTLNRISGTPDDFKAVAYVAGFLEREGIPCQVHRLTALISHPVRGRLVVLSPGGREFRVKARSFSATTPPGGVEAEVVCVAVQRPGIGLLDGSPGRELGGADVRGRVVLSESGGPGAVLEAQRAGAVGYVHVWASGEDVIHEMIVSPVWGSPVPETVGLLPAIPCLGMKRSDGLELAEMCRSGPVRVRIEAEADTRWRALELPVATVEGAEGPEPFALAAGHLDSWHVGTTDNATGNACLLELARVFNRFRGRLLRSIRFAWWPGHSYGRYAGSTWYADRFWPELYRGCFLYDNIDSPGSLGATDYSEITAMAETRDLGEEVVLELAGQKARGVRPIRAGDQSFWGAGVPSLFMIVSMRPPQLQAAVGGSGMGWWWHSEEDTLDKCDPDLLLQDTRIHLLALWRACRAPVLPFRYFPLAVEWQEVLADLAQAAAPHLDLSPLQERAAELACRARELDALADRLRARSAGRGGARARGGPTAEEAAVNRAFLSISKSLIPVMYTSAGEFDHDLAVPIPPLPGLQPVRDLARLDPSGWEFHLLLNRLVRQRNRAAFALDRALEACQAVLGRTVPPGSAGAAKGRSARGAEGRGGGAAEASTRRRAGE
ncbi:MAG: M28 family peptidase [Acetobacteraceae bacterium]|nr:M28 family peptidase [Acetobacteraceae bacterium]